MTWFASSANESESQKQSYVMFLAVELAFVGGAHRYWSGTGSLFINGNEYIGAGQLVSVSAVEERSTLGGERKTYQLSGVDPALVSETEIDRSFGRSVTEYFGFLNVDTRQLLDAPEINWEGRIDAIRRQDGAQPLIQVDAEHRLVLLEQADDWRYTDEHQAEFFPGDKGFDQVPTLDTITILWGGAVVRPGEGPRRRPNVPQYRDVTP